VIDEDKELDARLRPTSLGEFVGQSKVVSQVSLIIQAAKLEQRNLIGHCVFLLDQQFKVQVI